MDGILLDGILVADIDVEGYVEGMVNRVSVSMVSTVDVGVVVAIDMVVMSVFKLLIVELTKYVTEEFGFGRRQLS